MALAKFRLVKIAFKTQFFPPFILFNLRVHYKTLAEKALWLMHINELKKAEQIFLKSKFVNSQVDFTYVMFSKCYKMVPEPAIRICSEN